MGKYAQSMLCHPMEYTTGSFFKKIIYWVLDKERKKERKRKRVHERD